MAITLIGTFLDGQYYEYVAGSYKRSYPLKNRGDLTQTAKTFSVLGAGPEIHTLTFHLGNTFNVYSGTSYGVISGITQWLGISRLAFIKNVLNATGASLPITFVSPDGLTHSVVPTGVVDIQFFNPQNLTPESAEYRITVTLENTQ